MKLIFKYNWWIPDEASGTEIFVIECDSQIKLQVYVLDKIKETRKKEFGVLSLFGFDFYNLDDLENQIQYNVFTLDEWCEKEIIKIK
jgi:hypothetical protein